MTEKLIEDRNLGSNRDRARRMARVMLKALQQKHPTVRLQFSQHAPEGYDGAYSAQFFVEEENGITKAS